MHSYLIIADTEVGRKVIVEDRPCHKRDSLGPTACEMEIIRAEIKLALTKRLFFSRNERYP